MPKQKRTPIVPHQNVLDLRQILALRQEAERPKRSWRASKRPKETGLYIPGRQELDWRVWRRETTKYLAILVGALTPVAFLLGVAHVALAAHDVQSDLTHGARLLRDGGVQLSQFQSASATASFTAASQSFTQAENSLADAVAGTGRLAASLPIVDRKMTSVSAALDIGVRLSRVGARFSDLLQPIEKGTPAITINRNGVIQGSIGALGPLMAQPDIFQAGVNDIMAANDAAGRIALADVPAAYRPAFRLWQGMNAAFGGDPHRSDDIVKILTGLFAAVDPKEYLVVLENDDELRPTGGFLGTFALIKFERGTFTILDAPGTGPYDLAAQIPHTALPPQPILSIAPYWTFQDANWFFDAPTSSKTILDFYRQARGFTPDGVIYLTPRLFEDLLRVTGPIRPAGYTTDITAENFVRTTETQVETAYDKTLNNPKQFIIDLLPALIGKLSQLPAADALRATIMALEHADQGDLMITSQDATTQAAVARIGWDGGLKKTDGDYLAVVDTNLGGGKTDRVVNEDVHLTVSVDGGLLHHVVTVTRKHVGDPNDPLTGKINKDFIRLYTPAAAQLVDITGATVPPDGFFQTPDAAAKQTSLLTAAEGRVLIDPANGIRVTQESGRQVFGAWSVLEPGQSQTVTFTYTTPFAPDQKLTTWSLYWQKQPGAALRTWQVTFQAPARGRIDSTIPPSQRDGKGSATITTDSTMSKTFGVVFER